MMTYRVVLSQHGNSSLLHLAELRGPVMNAELVVLCGAIRHPKDTGRTVTGLGATCGKCKRVVEARSERAFRVERES